MSRLRDWPVWQLTVARLRLFIREPTAIFWVYGFPILMMMSLGIAFRDNPRELIVVDIVAAKVASDGSELGRGELDQIRARMDRLESTLKEDNRFKVSVSPAEDWRKRLQAGKTDLVIEMNPDGSQPACQTWDEPRRAESRLARYAVEAFLNRNPSPSSPPPDVKHLDEPGSRYIDFLLPGMIGMGLMGGGMWGVGFVVVDMRVRKLLKRFLATPMRRSDFLIAIILSRLIFTLADIVILLLFGYLAFGIRNQGSYLDLTAVVLLGGATFAGIGLLVASRVQTIETVSGLMNLVMLPMWILSGVFFSSERFPDVMQPLINLLPLTALNQALRGIMLEGKSLTALWPQLALLAAYGGVTFTVALRIFRWR
jgi:ABC-type multidrug transport system permease subunit